MRRRFGTGACYHGEACGSRLRSGLRPPAPQKPTAFLARRERDQPGLRLRVADLSARQVSEDASGPLGPPHGVQRVEQPLEALEHHLGQGRAEPARKARAEEWLRIPITPDVELTVRAPLDAEQRVRLERCADLIRDILLGRAR